MWKKYDYDENVEVTIVDYSNYDIGSPEDRGSINFTDYIIYVHIRRPGFHRDYKYQYDDIECIEETGSMYMPSLLDRLGSGLLGACVGAIPGFLIGFFMPLTRTYRKSLIFQITFKDGFWFNCMTSQKEFKNILRKKLIFSSDQKYQFEESF